MGKGSLSSYDQNPKSGVLISNSDVYIYFFDCLEIFSQVMRFIRIFEGVLAQVIFDLFRIFFLI